MALSTSAFGISADPTNKLTLVVDGELRVLVILFSYVLAEGPAESLLAFTSLTAMKVPSCISLD